MLALMNFSVDLMERWTTKGGMCFGLIDERTYV
jgi:hypothetical protein